MLERMGRLARTCTYVIPCLVCLGLLTAIDWGLPSDQRRSLLFFGDPPDSVTQRLNRSTSSYFVQRDMTDSLEVFRHQVNGNTYTYRPVPLPRTFGAEEKLAIMRRYLLGSGSADERQTYITLARMDPLRGDLNPRGSPYGGAYLYPLGGILFILDRASVLNLRSDASHFLRFPEPVRDLYVAGRLLSLLSFLGVAVLLLRIGTAMRTPRVGIAAMMTWVASSHPITQSLVSKPHVWSAFWVTLAVYLLYRAWSGRGAKDFLLSCIALGLGAGSSVTVLPLILAVPLLYQGGGDQRPDRRLLHLGLMSTVVAFGLTNPYLFSDPQRYLVTAMHYAHGEGYQYARPSLGRLMVAGREMFVRGIAFPLGLLALIGWLKAILSKEAFWGKIGLLWGLVFGGAAFFGGETRYVLFLIPIGCIYVGQTVDHLLSRLGGQRRGILVLAILFLPGLLLGGMTVGDYVADEDWMDDTKRWIAEGGLAAGTSVGFLDHPEPQNTPALPFLDLTIVGLDGKDPPGARPEIVVVGNSAREKEAWERSPIRGEYRSERVLGRPQSRERFVGVRIKSEARTAGFVFRRRE